jgi:hypothetical protein
VAKSEYSIPTKNIPPLSSFFSELPQNDNLEKNIKHDSNFSKTVIDNELISLSPASRLDLVGRTAKTNSDSLKYVVPPEDAVFFPQSVPPSPYSPPKYSSPSTYLSSISHIQKLSRNRSVPIISFEKGFKTVQNSSISSDSSLFDTSYYTSSKDVSANKMLQSSNKSYTNSPLYPSFSSRPVMASSTDSFKLIQDFSFPDSTSERNFQKEIIDQPSPSPWIESLVSSSSNDIPTVTNKNEKLLLQAEKALGSKVKEAEFKKIVKNDEKKESVDDYESKNERAQKTNGSFSDSLYEEDTKSKEMNYSISPREKKVPTVKKIKTEDLDILSKNNEQKKSIKICEKKEIEDENSSERLELEKEKINKKEIKDNLTERKRGRYSAFSDSPSSHFQKSTTLLQSFPVLLLDCAVQTVKPLLIHAETQVSLDEFLNVQDQVIEFKNKQTLIEKGKDKYGIFLFLYVKLILD